MASTIDNIRAIYSAYIIYASTSIVASRVSLAWPDPFRAAAYRSEIISAALLISRGIVARRSEPFTSCHV